MVLDMESPTQVCENLVQHETCGIDSCYYGVNIRTIKEGIITEDLLPDAFVRSANQLNGGGIKLV